MEASIVDLRYNMKNVLLSLNRNEEVKVFCHKKLVGTIVPPRSKKSKKSIRDHPFFGMHADEKKSVESQMKELRGGRYRDIDTDILIWVQRSSKHFPIHSALRQAFWVEGPYHQIICRQALWKGFQSLKHQKHFPALTEMLRFLPCR